MGKFDGVMIVSDVDGTFLGKDARIVPENLAAIDYFKREGGLFTLATGRDSFLIAGRVPDVRELCNCPVIASNGAYIYDLQSDRIIDEEFLPEPEASGVVDAVRAAYPEISLRITCGGKHLADKDYPLLQDVMERYPGCVVVVPYEEIPRGCWHHVTWMGEPEEMEAVRQAALSHMKGGCACASGGRTIFEITSAKGTKGLMLGRLKRLIGRENMTVWAIGDYENDISMLLAADRCAMPENGIDSLRSIPGIVEVCHHDRGAIAGLIRYIEHEIDCGGSRA